MWNVEEGRQHHWKEEQWKTVSIKGEMGKNVEEAYLSRGEVGGQQREGRIRDNLHYKCWKKP